VFFSSSFIVLAYMINYFTEFTREEIHRYDGQWIRYGEERGILFGCLSSLGRALAVLWLDRWYSELETREVRHVFRYVTRGEVESWEKIERDWSLLGAIR
jgi:hypothetical protein